MKPRVSVVIPAYRSAGTIAEAVASVRTQTVDDYEIIVVDDASPDHTADVVAGLLRGDRERLVRLPENGGPAAARNAAIAKAQGEWIGIDTCLKRLRTPPGPLSFPEN